MAKFTVKNFELKKFRRLYFILWMLCFCFYSRGYGFEENRNEQQWIESRIEDRINRVVKSFDPDAFALVNIAYEEQSLSLPSSPFKVTGPLEFMAGSSQKLKNVSVDIFMRKASELPEDFRNILESAGSPYVDKIEIKSQKQMAQPVSEELLQDKLRQSAQDNFLWVVMAGLLCVFFAIMLWLGFRMNQKSAKNIVSVLSALQHAMEHGGLGAGVSSKSVKGLSANVNSEEFKSPAQIEALHKSSSELPMEAIYSVLMDCYWTSKDAYAHFFWKLIPTKFKTELFDIDPGLKDYVAYFSALEAEAGSFHLESYYLRPLPITHLDNSTLTALVRKNPPLYFELGEIRKAKLELSLDERLNVFGMNQVNWQNDVDFKSIGPSKPRLFAKAIKFEIESVEQENEIIAKELPLEIMAQIPSLMLVSKLEPKVVADVLQNFSAQDLANAWIGPEDILSTMQALLPEKKRDLVLNYRKKIKADRSSESFKNLHLAVVAKYLESVEKKQNISAEVNENLSSNEEGKDAA